MYVCPSEIHTYMVYQPSMPLENRVGLLSVDPIESLNFSDGFDLCNCSVLQQLDYKPLEETNFSQQ